MCVCVCVCVYVALGFQIRETSIFKILSLKMIFKIKFRLM